MVSKYSVTIFYGSVIIAESLISYIKGIGRPLVDTHIGEGSVSPLHIPDHFMEVCGRFSTSLQYPENSEIYWVPLRLGLPQNDTCMETHFRHSLNGKKVHVIVIIIKNQNLCTQGKPIAALSLQTSHGVDANLSKSCKYRVKLYTTYHTF